MRFGSYQFVPSVLMTALFVLVGGAMLGLGAWQLQRAAEKNRILADEQRVREQPPLGVIDALQNQSQNGGVSASQRVVLSGKWFSQTQFLWDNRIHKGRAGYEVVTALRLTEGPLVLINRGWIPLGLSRATVPPIKLAETGQIIALTGFLTRPSKGYASGAAFGEPMQTGTNQVSENAAGEVRLLQYFDYSALEQLLGEPVLTGLVQGLGDEHAGIEGQRRVTAEVLPGDILYTDNWQPVAHGPEKHYGYAFQWWAMFVALAVLFVRLNLVKPEQNNPGTSGPST